MLHKKTKRKSGLKVGLPPGSLIFTGEQKVDRVSLRLIQYDGYQVLERELQNLKEGFELVKNFEGISWLDITGLHEVDLIDQIGTTFDFHKLTSEDILNTGQRPKIEEFEHYLYVVLKMFSTEKESKKIYSEQISFILTTGLLLTFQEKEGDVFEFVRKRLREGKGMIRQRGADYLLYALMDAVVDHYFLILENFGEQLDELELQVFDDPDHRILARIHHLRREMLELRRSVYPLREVISRFEKTESELADPKIKVYIRDLYDHTIQVIETIEVLRDMASGMVDLYLSNVSLRMNNVMKILTIIASIFIPLTFIAGVYGMNFENMPELGWEYGYYAILMVMAIIFLAMLLVFKRKKWL